MFARTYDKGSSYGVSLGEEAIRQFMGRWPASGLNGLRRVYFEFDKENGDLVDVKTNGRHGAGRFDGPALAALSHYAQGASTMGVEHAKERS